MIPQKIEPRQRIAKETNTSECYVQCAEKYMHGVEAAEDAVPGSKEEILSGHIKATDREICSIAKIPEPQRPEAVDELQKPKKRDKSILAALPEAAADQDTFDPDGRRFVTGIAGKIHGKKKKLSKEDREALKKSVDGRYYREDSSDGSLVLCDIQGAHQGKSKRRSKSGRNSLRSDRTQEPK